MKNIITLATLTLVSILSHHTTFANSITPLEHFKIQDPVRLSGEQANISYSSIIDKMRKSYALADYAAAKQYQRWIRFNKTPYLSAGHGNRYLNNYGNQIAHDYLSLQAGQQMPTGAILAKDSFTAKKDQAPLPGALFLMEKLSNGTRPDYGDWRYIMVLPNGSVLGDSEGANPQAMQFCHSCHVSARSTDYLFLIPAENRNN